MPTANWKRLGELLVRRRIELDPRYANRQLFAAERGAQYRIVSDAERGRRDNYGDATVTALEVAYALAPGSIRRAVAGGELEPLPVPPPAVPRNPFAAAAALGAEPEDDEAWVMFPEPGDQHLRWIWRSAIPEERVLKVHEAREWRRRGQQPRGGQSAGLPLPDGNVSDTDLNFV